MASGHSAQNSPNDQSRVTEEWEEGEGVGSKQFCCSGDDVGRQFGTFYVPLCERLSVRLCVCMCVWVWFIIMQIRPSRLVYL